MHRMEPAKKPRASRESRLLLVTIVVSAAVLIVLARLRFPEPPVVVDTAAPPLARLAARASYDTLAADIERVEATISPNLIVLRVRPRADIEPRRTSDVVESTGGPALARHVPALRIDAATAVAGLGADVRVDGIVGPAGEGGSAGILAADPVRRIARVRVPDGPVRQLPVRALASLHTPIYVVAVEGTRAGVTLRPVFLGRGDRFISARWTRPLLPLGGTAVAPGALLFSLDGEFLGCVVDDDGGVAIAGADDVLDAAGRLSAAPQPPSTAGIAVQPLTPALAAATGVDRGIVVAEVDAGGAASGLLEPGDVIRAVDGHAVEAPDQALLVLALRAPGEVATLDIVRHGEARAVTVTLKRAQEDLGGPPVAPVAFTRERGIGTRIALVAPGSTFAAAGLRPGDLVTRAGALTDPTPAQLRLLFDRAEPGTFHLLAIRRDDRQRVVAIEIPGRDDAQ